MIKILAVDDEAEICGYIKDFFNERGHVTFALTDPREVLGFIEKERPHIIILDIIMPAVSGLQLLKQIKDKYKDRVKVIMITIADEESTKKEATRLGADGFITKPFDSDCLEEVVMKKIEELLKLREETNEGRK